MIFKPVGVEDYGVLQGFFAGQSYRLSVYSLLSIIVWSGQKYRTSYAIDDNRVIFINESETDPEDRYLILPIPAAEDHTPAYLRDLAQGLDCRQYWFIPGDYVERVTPAALAPLFTVTEQTEYEDYVYLREDLVQLKGNRFAKKRNLLHQFARQFHEAGRVAVEPITPANANDCLAFLDEWCRRHNACEGGPLDDLTCEKQAIIQALNHLQALEGRGVAVRIDGNVRAFGIASGLNSQTGVLNFEKALTDIRGLYQFLDRECADRLFPGLDYINKESDMGLKDLAHSKKSYNPVLRVKSYRLTLR